MSTYTPILPLSEEAAEALLSRVTSCLGRMWSPGPAKTLEAFQLYLRQARIGLDALESDMEEEILDEERTSRLATSVLQGTSDIHTLLNTRGWSVNQLATALKNLLILARTRGLRYDEFSRHLVVGPAEEAIIEHGGWRYNFGQYLITLPLGDIRGFLGASYMPTVSFLRGLNGGISEAYPHPHVRGASICYGAGSAAISAMLREGQLVGALCMIHSLLCTYNSASPYRTIETWRNVVCGSCRETVSDGSLTQDPEQSTPPVCSRCISYCQLTGIWRRRRNISNEQSMVRCRDCSRTVYKCFTRRITLGHQPVSSEVVTRLLCGPCLKRNFGITIDMDWPYSPALSWEPTYVAPPITDNQILRDRRDWAEQESRTKGIRVLAGERTRLLGGVVAPNMPVWTPPPGWEVPPQAGSIASRMEPETPLLDLGPLLVIPPTQATAVPLYAAEGETFRCARINEGGCVSVSRPGTANYYECPQCHSIVCHRCFNITANLCSRCVESWDRCDRCHAITPRLTVLCCPGCGDYVCPVCRVPSVGDQIPRRCQRCGPAPEPVPDPDPEPVEVEPEPEEEPEPEHDEDDWSDDEEEDVEEND